jgi:hypothetical protein
MLILFPVKGIQKTLILGLPILFLAGCCKEPQPLAFKRMDRGHIVEDPGYSQGAAWGDYDNDGDEDLFVTNSWTNGNNFLYQNNGDGTFTKITDCIIVLDGGNSNGCTWGDMDNDGDLDLFVANVDNQDNFLYINNGDKSFTKVKTGAVVTDGGWSYTCSWVDYNNDGWLDLFVGNYKNQPNFLYTNNGKGQLLKNKETVITTEKNSTQGCTWSDFDNDGRVDLYVANMGLNNLFRNLGNGQFEKMKNIPPVGEEGNSFGCSAGDFNNDGYSDLFVANWWGKNHLYLNRGNMQFEKISGSPVTEENLNSEGSAWGDMDNDGDLDLMVTNDGNNSLFENREGQFVKRINLIVANDSSNSNGVTWNDYDNDGDLDIFIANGGNQPNLLYRNCGNNYHWLKVKCLGHANNRSALGAKVTIFQGNRRQYREVSGQTGGGYGAQSGIIQHIGLGKKETVDSVQVEFPRGTVKKIIRPGMDQLLVIPENEPAF